MTEPILITHVITDLDTGGAEMMLYKIISAINPKFCTSRVVSLTDIGPIGRRIMALGVEVISLNMKSGRLSLKAILDLASELKRSRTDLVQTWMYHADLIGGLAAFLAGGIPTVWNIRNSNLDKETSKRSTRLLVLLNAFLSSWMPQKILVCSRRAREIHQEKGYSASKMVMAPNGFDLTEFKPDPAAKKWMLEQLELPGTVDFIGLAARFDPQKDIATFIRASKIVAEKRRTAHFILCGEGMTEDNPVLSGWIAEANLEARMHLLGRREDMPRVTPAFDLAVSSSAYGEAFSNVIGEAMACGVPCVATNVGDAAEIIADTGLVVAPRDPQGLAAAMIDILKRPADERLRLGLAARRRIEANYELNGIAKTYMQIYQEVIH